MADAIADGKLINVYAGGGSIRPLDGRNVFRAADWRISIADERRAVVFNQALKYLELERTVNFVVRSFKYYDLQKDDLLISSINRHQSATIDAGDEAKKRGQDIAVARSFWQQEMPKDHFIRHPSGKNLFDTRMSASTITTRSATRSFIIPDGHPMRRSPIWLISPLRNLLESNAPHLCGTRTSRPYGTARTRRRRSEKSSNLKKYKPL